MPKPSDLLQGTLGRWHGNRCTAGRSPGGFRCSPTCVLAVGQGSLYPALHRLENQGWVAAEWKSTELGREAKFYALTREGKRQLERELASWTRLSSAVGLLLQRA